MEQALMRYVIQLELLERNDLLRDRQAIELLHSEFVLAHNAARFDALSAGDIELRVISRKATREGVTRYTVALYLEERDADLDDRGALALLDTAFTAALNASYFLRICLDDRLTVKLVSRDYADEAGARRAG